MFESLGRPASGPGDPAPPVGHAASALTLSLVLPAYNESLRLPPYLATIRPYLDAQYRDAYEVIVVDDGSSDHLQDALSRLCGDWPQLTLARHPRNLGKGAAVRTGIQAARGDRVLFADADGATPIEEEQRLRTALTAGADVAIGSRLVTDSQVMRQRTWRRAMVGRAFAAVARRLFSLPVQDTQCGFKMFRRAAAQHLFALAQENGYLFDIEILALARQLGLRVAEVPINWADRPGSRLSLWKDSRVILAGLRRVYRRLKRLSVSYDSTRPN
jgi:dolichyl-phosphate beta-glucosyltransferase